MDTQDFGTVNAVKRKFLKQLRSLPHVRGVGVGKKVTAGDETERLAVKVYVDRKLDLNELSEDERVPPILDGVPTDVEVISELRARN